MSLRDLLNKNPVKPLNSVLNQNLQSKERSTIEPSSTSERRPDQETKAVLDKRPRKSIVSTSEGSEDEFEEESEPIHPMNPAPVTNLNSNPIKKIKNNSKQEVKVNKEVKPAPNNERHLVSISDLSAITLNKNCKKRFKIRVKWNDGSVEHVKHIRFGRHGKEEFIDHHDEDKRTKRVDYLINRLDKKGGTEFLQEEYYIVSLLNNLPTVNESYGELLRNITKL